MPTIDLILTWPSNCDFPLFREWLSTHAYRFKTIYIIFHETNTAPDLRNDVRDAIDLENVNYITYDGVPSGRDWRDYGIHFALDDSTADRVCFIEQDFFMYDGFWSKVAEYIEYPVIGINDHGRIHPCFLLMKRDALEKTCKNFGIVPNELDHFGLIQKDIESGKCGPWTMIPDYPKNEDKLYHHMNGLSHNLRLMFEGLPVTYHEQEFRDYLRKTLTAKVPLSPVYVESVEKYLEGK